MAADLTVRAIPETKVADATPLASRPGSVKKAADPAEKFEAFVLQSFIQDMMPKSAEGVFGSGLAGDFWKSMMSEKIAEQVAARGGLGISDYVREGHLPSVRPGGLTSLDVMKHLSPVEGAFAAQGGIEPNSGE